MLVVYCDNPERLREKLYREGVDSATHFSNSIYWASVFGYRHGECPNAEKLITRLLMIPIY
jgi:dTDP-4-amino-4,6-dideoxygalactose transaminase